MKRPRFLIAGLMAAVAAVAVNLAVMRAFDETRPESLSHLFYACGVMPMASILILVALFSAPNVLRGGKLSPFSLGFEAVGWAVVFAYVTCYSLAPSVVFASAEYIGRYTRPVLTPYTADSPRWLAMAFELGVGAVIFTVPELIVALLGGWLTQRFGLTARFEVERPPSVPGDFRPDCAPHAGCSRGLAAQEVI
jgi:hypothetical protein